MPKSANLVPTLPLTRAEASAQKEYDEFMDDFSDDKAKKATDIEHKTAKKQDESQALRDLEWQGNCLSAA